MVQITLTSTQMDAVNAKGEHILIKGVPGSGKTTTLIAKLAILARKWPFSNSGIFPVCQA